MWGEAWQAAEGKRRGTQAVVPLAGRGGANAGNRLFDEALGAALGRGGVDRSANRLLRRVHGGKQVWGPVGGGAGGVGWWPPDDVAAVAAGIDAWRDLGGGVADALGVPEQKVPAAGSGPVDAGGGNVGRFKPPIPAMPRIYVERVETVDGAGRNADQTARKPAPKFADGGFIRHGVVKAVRTGGALIVVAARKDGKSVSRQFNGELECPLVRGRGGRYMSCIHGAGPTMGMATFLHAASGSRRGRLAVQKGALRRAGASTSPFPYQTSPGLFGTAARSTCTTIRREDGRESTPCRLRFPDLSAASARGPNAAMPSCAAGLGECREA